MSAKRMKYGFDFFSKKAKHFHSRAAQWYDLQQIRVKLIITIGFLFIVSMLVLSLLILDHGQRVLHSRLQESCRLSLRHVSESIKDDLLLYYLAEKDATNLTVYTGHIREAIHDTFNEDIEGLEYACIIDRYGQIVAHTNNDKINQSVSPQERRFFSGLKRTKTRELDHIIEYIHPLYALRENAAQERVFLGVTVLGFSQEVIFQPIKKARRTIMMTFFIVTVLSVLVIFYIARRMTEQIDALSDGVRRVGRGNLNVQIPVMSRDEIGKLAKEFNSMIVHLREKMQMQKFVSKLTLQMIRKRSTDNDLLPIGERRTVTILFTDVRNFSSLTQELGAEEIVKLINIYFDLQTKIVEENGGIVDKFMGDQLMAIFLGERADEAVHTAVEIQRSIRLLNQSRRRKREMILTIGCGLHTGSAVLGNMGSKNRLDYTCVGDVVNLASRLCAVAQPGQIIIPYDMVSQLGGEYETIRLNPIQVKGIAHAVEIFEVEYETDPSVHNLL